jgi:hypothetical protein
MKKLAILILACLLAVALMIPVATPAMAASTATFGDKPSDWEKTENRIVENTSTGLGSATAWTDDGAWGGWTTPAWDGPSNGIYGNPISYWVENDTWIMWSNVGDDWETHTDQWFRTTFDIPGNWSVTAVELLYKYSETMIPVNDDLYVYVDDNYVAAGGTAGVPSVQAQVGQVPPTPTYGSNTFVPAVDPFDFGVAPETGWYLNYIDGGLNLPPELFTPGPHDIHVLGEEFDVSGGLGHLIIKITYDVTKINTTTTTKLSLDKKSCFGKLPCFGKKPTIILGQSVQDTATVTGADATAPTGDVEFQWSNDGGTTWNPLSTGTLTASGPDTATATSNSFTPTAPGNYFFKASYVGDVNYNSSYSDYQTEPLTVCKIPTFARTQLSARMISSDGSVTDKITIYTMAKGTLPAAGGTWTVQASKYCRFNKDVVEVDSGTVTGNLPFVVTTKAFTPTSIGTWYFRVIYEGDSNYNNSQNCGLEVLCVVNKVVKPPQPPCHH